MSKAQSDSQLSGYAFTLRSEAELLATFREKDRKKILLPRLIPYPVHADYYYAWSESSGTYVYLIFKKPDWTVPAGVIFKRAHATGERQMGRMCDWCHSYGGADEISMLTTALDSKITAGLILCTDLSCFDKLEDIANQSKKSIDKLALGLIEKMGRFMASVHRPPSN